MIGPRRSVSRARRVANTALGALSGGAAGAATVWLAAPPDRVVPWIVGVLTALGAAFGYRYGRGVVRATARSLWEACW